MWKIENCLSDVARDNGNGGVLTEVILSVAQCCFSPPETFNRGVRRVMFK